MTLLWCVRDFYTFHLRVVLHEEPFLARTHGARWDDDARRVPRWFF